MRTMAALVFPEFQTLDFFGPIEMLGGFRDEIEIVTVAKTPDPVPSRHGQRISVDKVLREKSDYDLSWIKAVSANAERVMAVCTGTVLLGMTGVLDGRKATTNKLDFADTIHLAPNVEWIKKARWVEDGKFFTSSGVSAGMDMALAAAASLFGLARAEEMAEGCEYVWNNDADHDPFAKAAGLI